MGTLKSFNVPLPTGSYHYQTKKVSSQRLCNCYSQTIEHPNSMSNDATGFAIVSVPGSTSAVDFTSVTSASKIGIRGMYASSDGPAPDFGSRLYVAVGNSIYRVNSDHSYAHLGDVGENTIRVNFSESGGLDSQLCIVDGYNLYICPTSAADDSLKLTTVTLPNIAGTENQPIMPSQIAFLDGYIILNTQNSNQFYYSSQYDVTTSGAFSDLNFYTAYGSPDKINGIINVGGNLFIFGPRSFEIWNTTSNVSEPFARIGGSFEQIGLQAPETLAVLQSTLFWLGSGPQGHNIVFASDPAGNVNRISDNALESLIDSFKDPTNAIAFTYSKNGNYFYVLTFVGDDRTFVYDVSTKEWHERSTRDRLLNIEHKWNPLYAVDAYGKLYFGSVDSPVLLFLDSTKTTEWDGRPIVRTVITPIYFDNYNRFVIREFKLYCNTGETKILQGQGSDPQIMLQVSDDGGYTWSSEYWQPLGRTGQYLNEVRWFNLGETRNGVIKLTVSDPIDIVFIGAKLVTVGMRND